jgi:MATE family multidrug resistance protein
MMISIVGACVNAVVDYLLIYGKLGLPKLGVTGAGYATSLVQWVMLGAALLYVLRDPDLRSYRFFRHLLPLDFPLLKRLVKLGVPIGLGSSMENGVFAFTSLLMGRISTVALASHQVAINVAAFTFMVPLGISTAATTRVGQAMGRGEPRAAALAGWTAIGLGVAFMSCTALAFISFPGAIISIYSDDPQVLVYAAGLLTIAGAFQIVDGMQVVAIGALRGLKDTARPLLVNLFAYWVIGLPIGYTLAFVFGHGGHGLWWGLSAGLAVAALLHSLRFRRLTAA